jgi:hypothetical protein
MPSALPPILGFLGMAHMGQVFYILCAPKRSPSINVRPDRTIGDIMAKKKTRRREATQHQSWTRFALRSRRPPWMGWWIDHDDCVVMDVCSTMRKSEPTKSDFPKGSLLSTQANIHRNIYYGL